MTKRSKRPKHLSSEDFLKQVDEMWQLGPAVKYRNPDSWQNPTVENSKKG